MIANPMADPGVAERVEELLREQLVERGIEVSKTEPHVIAAHMRCHVEDDNSMTYFWDDDPLLRVFPEVLPLHPESPKSLEDGEIKVHWRMFTAQ